jgi:ATP-dependent RNA helicase UAP56/SUB2
MKYLDKEKYSCEVIYGGQPLSDHIKMLKKTPPTILICTPGRTNALVKNKHLKLENMKHFILDECDQMLEALDMR